MLRSVFHLLKALNSPDRHFYFSMVKMLGFLPGKRKLYNIAFLHKSASTTSKNGQVLNNERLEFLGDAILDAIIAEYLYLKFPENDEGFLTQLRSKIVKRKQLNKLAYSLGIELFLVSRTNADQTRINLMGNALEALIGAIYLDKGYRRAKRFVIKRILKKHLNVEKLAINESDFKSRIIEWAQKNKQDISFVSQEEVQAGSYETYFSSHVLLVGRELGAGTGHSKKDAEQKAAEEALTKIEYAEENP